MKKYKIFIACNIICSLILINKNVFAANKENIYYKNENGVNLTTEEYNFLSQLYWDGYQKLITVEEYQNLKSLNIFQNEIETKYLVESNMRSTSISTPKKILKVSKSCSSDCIISTTVTWKTNPVTRSYDVIGAYLNGTRLTNNPITNVISSTQKDVFKDTNFQINGFGQSIKIPSSGNNIIINQSFKVHSNGVTFISYQHAKKKISLQNSNKYVISSDGYGRVFKFENSISSIYDGMQDLSLELK